MTFSEEPHRSSSVSCSSVGSSDTLRIPHVVSMFNPHDYTSAALQCDLTNLTVAQMATHAERSFSLLPHTFDMVHNGHPLDENSRAIDAGIGNGAVVVVQVRPTPPTSPPMMMMQRMINVPMCTQVPGYQPYGVMPMSMGMGMSPYDPPVRSGSGSSYSTVSVGCDVDVPPDALWENFCKLAVTSEGSASLLNSLQQLHDATETAGQLLPLILPRFLSLATNHHASKVMIGIANVASPTQVNTLLTAACDLIVPMCESTSGAEMLVAMVGTTGTAKEFRNAAGTPLLVQSIADNIQGVGVSVNGRKVLQTVLHKFGDAAGPIYEAAVPALLSLCTDQCGCITVQRLLDHAEGAASTQLFRKLYSCVCLLLVDPFGNYVVQHALKIDPDSPAKVAAAMKGGLLQFAMNKFSSNVIEQCLQAGDEEVRASIIQGVTTPSVLKHLMQDSYGNYVVQSAIEHAGPHLEQIRTAVAPLIAQSPFGYRIETKLQKMLKKAKQTAPRKEGGGGGGARREPLGKLANTHTNPHRKGAKMGKTNVGAGASAVVANP